MSVVNPREIFNVAIKNMASAIIIAHNHPSGASMPSNEDISLTKKVMNLSEMLGIDFLDHVIIAKRGSISLRKEGYVKFD